MVEGELMKLRLFISVFALTGASVARAGDVVVDHARDGQGMHVSTNPGGTVLLSVTNLSGGVVHDLPLDLRDALAADREALRWWEDITPLARNEWICWVGSAKKAETRNERIRRVREELKEGKRRPCCWAGCKHRERSGK